MVNPLWLSNALLNGARLSPFQQLRVKRLRLHTMCAYVATLASKAFVGVEAE